MPPEATRACSATASARCSVRHGVVKVEDDDDDDVNARPQAAMESLPRVDET